MKKLIIKRLFNNYNDIYYFKFLILRKITMFEIFPDETNTLAILAKLTGNFWDLDKAYYGWGGVIFYYPLFLLIKNPILLYKSILLVNAILLSFIPCIS